MSEQLRQFLREYLAWVATGGDERHACFDRGLGLCANLYGWQLEAGIKTASLALELKRLFEQDGLNTEYPFMSDDEYFDECEHDTCWQNPVRLAWVRSKLTGE